MKGRIWAVLPGVAEGHVGGGGDGGPPVAGGPFVCTCVSAAPLKHGRVCVAAHTRPRESGRPCGGPSTPVSPWVCRRPGAACRGGVSWRPVTVTCLAVLGEHFQHGRDEGWRAVFPPAQLMGVAGRRACDGVAMTGGAADTGGRLSG